MKAANILLLPGAYQSSAMWNGVINRLALQNPELGTYVHDYQPALIGREATISGILSDIRSTVFHRSIDVIVGYSLGAILGCLLAKHNLNGVVRIVALCPPTSLPTLYLRIRRWMNRLVQCCCDVEYREDMHWFTAPLAVNYESLAVFESMAKSFRFEECEAHTPISILWSHLDPYAWNRSSFSSRMCNRDLICEEFPSLYGHQVWLTQPSLVASLIAQAVTK